MTVSYRDARASDSLQIAAFLCIAGGGLYEFLFDRLFPFMSAKMVLAAGIASRHHPVSHRRCHVAEDVTARRLVGAVNVFPADLLRQATYALLPAERRRHVAAMTSLQDWGSLFLNALAVSEGCRGSGVGSRLMDWAEAEARRQGFDRLSLHVWADNAPARAFYRDRGFVDLGVAEVSPHPRLPHEGGSVLMRKTLHP